MLYNHLYFTFLLHKFIENHNYYEQPNKIIINALISSINGLVLNYKIMKKIYKTYRTTCIVYKTITNTIRIPNHIPIRNMCTFIHKLHFTLMFFLSFCTYT